MDQIDITDTAFSLASSSVPDLVSSASDLISLPAVNEVLSSLPGVNEVLSSASELAENTDTGINIYFIIGFLLLIGVLFLYNYFTNRAKKVTFNENVENYYNQDA